jgi:hypothetical protein
VTTTDAGGGTGATEKTSNNMPAGWRALLLVLALVSIAGAAGVWLPATPVTVKTQTESTTDSVVAPKSKNKTTTASRTTQHVTTKKTVTVNGRASQEATAKPSGSEGRRSETLTIALVGAGFLLLILAAIGKVPTKFGAGTFSAEWAADVAPQAAASLASEAAKQGVDDPERLRQASELLFEQLLQGVSAVTPSSPGLRLPFGMGSRRRATGGEATPSDALVQHLAERSVAAVIEEPTKAK